MLILELKGRLGNQMFRYAYMRALLEARKANGIVDEVLLDLSDFQNKDSKDGWENSLKYFNIISYETITDKYVYSKGSFSQKFWSKLYYGLGKLGAKISRNFQLKLQRLITPLISKFGLIYSLDNAYDFSGNTNEKLIIDGSFENPKFFAPIREKLLNEFQPREPRLQHNAELYKIIESNNSVCISIRRGDFVENKYFREVYDVCNQAYFLRAIELAKRLIDNPVFIFFSDDIAWVKENISVDVPAYYEKGDDPVWEKLRLMYSCKHFIISNSTFSWWAQYLSTNPSKIVISPDHWYRDNRPQYLIQDSFVKVVADR